MCLLRRANAVGEPVAEIRVVRAMPAVRAERN
jgi:hypothetical protein